RLGQSVLQRFLRQESLSLRNFGWFHVELECRDRVGRGASSDRDHEIPNLSSRGARDRRLELHRDRLQWRKALHVPSLRLDDHLAHGVDHPGQLRPVARRRARSLRTDSRTAQRGERGGEKKDLPQCPVLILRAFALQYTDAIRTFQTGISVST